MRRRLVLLAVAGTFVGGTVTASLASPPDNHGTQTACAAFENSDHGQGQGQGGPPEDNNGLATAEGVLGCQDDDSGN